MAVNHHLAIHIKIQFSVSIMSGQNQNIREVLSTSFNKFGVQDMRLAVSDGFMGIGVFTTDGEYWEHSRKPIAPMFSRAQVSDLSALDVQAAPAGWLNGRATKSPQAYGIYIYIYIFFISSRKRVNH